MSTSDEKYLKNDSYKVVPEKIMKMTTDDNKGMKILELIET